MRALVRIAVGLILGLALAEGAFWLRDDGAFPHLSFYEADPILGTRLAPHREQRLAFSGNPVTRVRTNALGLRGADWPAPGAAREVLVVGDSQVFGLGVEEDQTFSARLAERLGRPVLNAGVPTYGPGEYLEVARRLLAARPSIDTLVLGLNMSNDVFEASAPNRARHAVWDGWAVRVETAPTEAPLAFPGRAWLMSRSHLVFAARALLHARQRDAEVGFPSEGGVGALVSETGALAEQRQAVSREDAALAARLEARDAAEQALRRANDAVFRAVTRHRDDRTNEVLKSISGTSGDPRDILTVRYAESARPVDLTAYALLRAALALRNSEAALARVPELASDPQVSRAFAQRAAAEAQLTAAEAASRGVDTATATSALGAVIAEAARLAEERRVTLVVLVLPLDVQVSSDEWKKYGLPPTDLSATRALNADAVAHAAQLGVRAVDPLPALAGTRGAFLQGDLHLTPRGHQAVADAIADVMGRPPAPPAADDRRWLPPGRSFLPSPESWRLAPEIVVKGSSKARCETKLIREWFRMICADAEARRPLGFADGVGGRGEAVTFRVRSGASVGGAERMDYGLLVPLLPGDEVAITVQFTDGDQRVTLTPPEARGFGPLLPRARTVDDRQALPEGDPGQAELYLDRHCDTGVGCWIAGNLDEHACQDGFVRFGVLGRCVPACGEGRPACEGGAPCRAWLGRQGCAR